MLCNLLLHGYSVQNLMQVVAGVSRACRGGVMALFLFGDIQSYEQEEGQP